MAALDFDRCEELVRGLAAALSARRSLYGDQARAEASLRAFAESLRGYLGHGQRGRVFRLTLSRGGLAHRGIALNGTSAFHRVAGRLQVRGCGGLVLDGSFTIEALEKLLDWLLCRREWPEHEDWPGVEVIPAEPDDDAPGGGGDVHERRLKRIQEFQVPFRIYAGAVDLLDHLMDRVRHGRPVDFHDVLDLARWAAEEAFQGTGAQLAAPAQLRIPPGEHVARAVQVFLLATTVLRPLAKSPQALARVSQAALLHDIGLSTVPEEILRRGARTAVEHARFRMHCEYGAEVLQGSPEVDPLAVHVAFTHHMNDAPGARGYPRPALAVRPGPAAQAVQVCSRFLDVCSRRPEGRSLTTTQAVAAVAEEPGMTADARGTILEILRATLTDAPPGAVVALPAGEQGVVIAANGTAPRVLVFAGRRGEGLLEPHECTPTNLHAILLQPYHVRSEMYSVPPVAS